MSVMLTADWSPLGRDIYFRKFELYPVPFQHEIHSQNFLVAAPYGGPIAVTRNPNKLVKVQGASKPVISIYSSSGRPIASFQWNSGQLVMVGWSHQEELLCVQDDGLVLIYDMFGIYQHTFSMRSDSKDTKVVAAKFFPTVNGTGVAVLTSTNRIYLANNIAEPKVRQLGEIPKTGGPVDCWCVIPSDRDSHVLAANQEGLYQINDLYQKLTPIPFNTYFANRVNNITTMAVSGNNRHIALYSDTGHLWLGSVDLKRKYCEFFTDISGPVSQVAWCGTEAVVCCWNGIIIVVGRTAETIMYTYDGPVHLITEIDGIRVLSTMSHEMIQKVPNVVQKIFRINSTDPASYLLEASKQFQKRSHKADSYIDLVKEKLDTAINDCIEAASYEFDFDTQKLLMRAAKFGKGFSRTVNPDYYVTMCRQLRVLNAVRHQAIGIPLTYTQLRVLSEQVLLDRLVARRHYYLSIQIARHLQLPEVDGESRILAHWACFKVKQTQLDKEQIAEEIADKLGYAPGVSYSEIAVRAADCGRKQLAIKLIDYEPRAQLQVPLLLRLDEKRSALDKAVESGNTDLVYTVILQLQGSMSLADFQRFIMRFPMAMALYVKYCQEHNRETLYAIYHQHDDFHSKALCFIKDAYLPKNAKSKGALLQSAQENFKLAKNETNAALTEEQVKLLRYQRSLEDTLHESGIEGKSLHETVKLLLVHNELRLADKLRSEYKLPDRRYWWLRIQSMAEGGLWNELEKFARSKKSPIGYEPFVDECLKHGQPDEARKYLPKVRDELKVKYFSKLDMLLEAAQIAFEQKDKSALKFVLVQCKPADTQIADKINNMIISLRNGKVWNATS